MIVPPQGAAEQRAQGAGERIVRLEPLGLPVDVGAERQHRELGACVVGGVGEEVCGALEAVSRFRFGEPPVDGGGVGCRADLAGTGRAQVYRGLEEDVRFAYRRHECPVPDTESAKEGRIAICLHGREIIISCQDD